MHEGRSRFFITALEGGDACTYKDKDMRTHHWLFCLNEGTIYRRVSVAVFRAIYAHLERVRVSGGSSSDRIKLIVNLLLQPVATTRESA